MYKPNKNLKSWSRIYLSLDFLFAALTWLLFFIYRKKNEIHPDYFEWNAIWNDSILYVGMILIPAAWLILYQISDQYAKIHRQSRIIIVLKSFFQSVLGGLILLFTILVDDDILQFQSYLSLFSTLVFLHFVIISFGRVIFLTFLKQRIKNGHITFKTLLIGNGNRARSVVDDISKIPSWGYELVGFFSDSGNDKIAGLPSVKKEENLIEWLEKNEIEELIFAKEKDNQRGIDKMLNQLYPTHHHIQINTIAESKFGNARWRIRPISTTEIVALDLHQMPKWERVVKRFFDVVLSVLVVIFIMPLIIWIFFKVKLSSSDSVLYKQERKGYGGANFNILKFRSMYEGAELKGPALSFEGDKRCTPFGTFMRKWRLDEIPQFINVIKGDMSLVGPRPERQYYIDQLLKYEPRYYSLLTVRPGITSLGQVKYGYASDIDQMKKRLKFDLLYIDNVSLKMDIKILFYTILVLLQGKGK